MKNHFKDVIPDRRLLENNSILIELVYYNIWQNNSVLIPQSISFKKTLSSLIIFPKFAGLIVGL